MPCRSSQGGSKVERRELAQADPLPVLWHPGTCLTTFGPSGSPRYCAARQPAPSPIPCLLLPCLSRALLSCARLQGERPPRERQRDRETGRLSRQAGHLSIDRSPEQLTGALACRSPLALQVTSNPPQVHCVLVRIESTAVESPASSIQPLRPPANSDIPFSQPPKLPTRSPSWTTALARDPRPRPGRGPRPGPDLPAFLLARLCLDGAAEQRSHRRQLCRNLLVSPSQPAAQDSPALFSTTPRRSIPNPASSVRPVQPTALAFLHLHCLSRPPTTTPLQFEPRAAAAVFDPATIAHTVMADRTA